MVKVLDFGLAKAFQADPSNATTVTVAGTEAGVILGTPAYMSPEQARGRLVDKRTDMWAFGCVLFEMLSGQRAFGADTHSDTVAAILGRDPNWQELPSAAPSGLTGLLRRCLHKDHARRQRDLGDVSIELEELRDLPDADKEPSHRNARPRTTRPLTLAWTIAGLGVVLTTAVLVWSITSSSPPSAVMRTLLSVAPASRIPMGNTALNMAISRDGRWLAYGADALGRPGQLYLRNLAEGVAQPTSGTVAAAFPFFSPDGQWVGFFDFVENQLKKVSVTGGTPITLCPAPGARGGSWGENGMIVFASPSRAALSQVSEDGGTPEPVTELDTSLGETSHRQPRLLPGGHAVLFKAQGTVTDDNHTWIQSLTTGERHRLVDDAEFATYSPTGHLVYVQDGNLIAAPFDLDRLELVGPAVTVVNSSGGAVRQFTLSDTGMLVYAAGFSEDLRLVWVSRETGEAQPLAAPPGRYLHAHLSPDEERILVDGLPGVGIFEISSGVLEPLVPAGNWAIWTPDGRRVTYARRQAGTVYDIFEIPSDGSGTEEALVVRDLMQLPQAWSPDGRTLAFAETPDHGIWLLSLEGERTAREWLQTPATERELQFSPDGRWIAYSSNESGRFEVYVRSLAGDVTRAISTEGGGAPRWSEDGRELFYRSGDGMYVVEVSTDGTFERGLPTLLFEGPYLGDVNDIASYDVTGDAKRFLMITRPQSEATQMQLNVVQNWFEELKARVPVP